MIELYEYPPTRSQRAKWALEELGLDYESCVVDLMKGEQNTDSYRELQPLGSVPALKAPDYAMFESVAIVMQLIDEHPEKGLAPAPGSPERAAYYQWNVFAAAELDPAVMMFFDNTLRPLEGMRPPGTPHDAGLAERGRREFEALAEILSRALDGRNYLAGSDFSGADITIGHSCFMGVTVGLMAQGDYPVLDAYFGKLQEREAYKRAYAGR